ncbi:MAG: hypothetical protein ABGY75_19770, partial [Gemmataceae bacterium]
RRPAAHPDVGVIGNAPFGSGDALVRLAGMIARHPALLEGVPDHVRHQGAAGVLLAFALATNPGGVTVCGMHTTRNIEANVGCASAASGLDAAGWAAVGERLRALAEHQG